MTTMIRQGDVYLVRADIARKPRRKAVTTGKVVLALGEVTGHSHTITGDVAEFVVDGKRMIWVAAPAPLTHQEHGAIEIQPGAYWVVRQREYTPEEIRNVKD